METTNTAFIVLSCDKYSDLWPIFISQFERNWSDCPYERYFITNFKSIPTSSFKELKIGDDVSWSDGLIKALMILKEKFTHVLITLEDLPLTHNVDNKKFTEIVNEFHKLNGNYLKFVRKPRPTQKFNSHFGIIGKGSLYRPTSVYALWNIQTFLSLLRKEENAWEFERFGAVRSDQFSGFYVVYEDFFKVINTVVKGEWVPSELDRLRKMGIQPKLERPILSSKSAFILSFKTIIFKIFVTIIPWKLRRKIVFKVKHYEGKYHNPNIQFGEVSKSNN